MKLFVIGHGRHGKDTAAEIISRCTGLTFRSSSLFVLDNVIYPAIGHRYASREECYEDRHRNRGEWYRLILKYNFEDRSRLSREIFAAYDMYVGIRNRKEYLASRHLADLSIWVDSFGRHPQEDPASMTILRSDADVIVENSGSQAEFQSRVERLCATWTSTQ